MAGERQIERWIVAQTRKLGGQAYRNIRRRAPVRTGRLMRSIRQTYRRKTTSVSPASPRLKGRTSTSRVRAGGIRAGVPYAKYVGSYHAVMRNERNNMPTGYGAPLSIFTLRYGDRTVTVRIRLGRFVRVRLARDSHPTYIRGYPQLPPASPLIGVSLVPVLLWL